MSNIWEVLLQAVSISVTAGIILVVKRFLSDKLSPRWQYAVWSILAVRILIPANSLFYIFQPFPLWCETLKGIVEKGLDSEFTNVYEMISPAFGIPVLKGIPESLTDILFTVIFLGMIMMFLYYAVSYIRIKRIVNGGSEISAEMENIIDSVSAKYGIKRCRAVCVQGISSAFVTGVFRPVLVLPCGELTDEKIILHELMHLRYCDGLQNIFWSALKAVNWYNPFMWYVFNIIGNDMESLCDQRVLEVLEGEERRQYGVILLDMVNDRYSRAVGTSSISNGGKNISRRIEAIVRFKKYPRGMSVVSVCIIVIMMFSIITGQSITYGMDYYRPSYENVDYAMALARTNRCMTAAGAIDTYAKGLMQNNIIMIAGASSLSEHEKIEEMINANSPHEKYYYDSGYELEFINVSEGYRVYNLTEQDDGSFTARLLLHTNGIRKEGSDEMLRGSDGEIYANCCVSIGLRIFKEDHWCVVEEGERRIETNYLNLYQPPFEMVDAVQDLSAKGETGTVRIRSYVQYEIHSDDQSVNGRWNQSVFNQTPATDALFDYASIHFYCEYDSNTRTTNTSPKESYGIQIIPVDSPDENVEWPDTPMNSSVSGTSSDGFNWAVNNVREWDEEKHESVKEYYGKVQLGSSTGISGKKILEPINPEKYYKARIFWDGEPVEEMVISEVE